MAQKPSVLSFLQEIGCQRQNSRSETEQCSKFCDNSRFSIVDVDSQYVNFPTLEEQRKP